MGNCCGETVDKRCGTSCFDQLKVVINPEFSEFYYAKKQELKKRGFFDLERNASKELLGLLTSKYHISNNNAVIWMLFYLDFMILWAFNKLKEKEMELHPPFAVETVLKMHILIGEHFRYLVKILTQDECEFKYRPYKITVTGNTVYYEKTKQVYEETRLFIMENLYDHPHSHQGKTKLSLAKGIWEDFEINMLKNEFNFYFFSSEEKENFVQVLKSKQKILSMTSMNPYNFINVSSSLRINMNLAVFNYYQDIQVPNISQKLKKKGLDKNALSIVEIIDQMLFPSDLGRLLAWEHMITKQQATLWLYEYKKFLFLIAIAKEKILCPSEKIEQTWHLHCIHSGHYQEIAAKLCLGYDLYKTKAAINDHENYQYTLKLYKSYFGTPDPIIWPEKKPLIGGRYSNFFLAFGRKALTEQSKNQIVNKHCRSETASFMTDKTDPKDKEIPSSNEDKADFSEFNEMAFNSFIFDDHCEQMDVICEMIVFDHDQSIDSINPEANLRRSSK